jgi:hypothetical protein
MILRFDLQSCVLNVQFGNPGRLRRIVPFDVSSTLLLEFAIDLQSCVSICLIGNPAGSLRVDVVGFVL